ncbi:MAG: hypothetical protein M3Q36_04570 [bacterium]|nr:hypothetical protein [bacterium]
MSQNSDRTGYRVGEPDEVTAQYVVERRPDERGGFRDNRWDIVQVDDMPKGGLKELIRTERRRRGIGPIRQFLLGVVEVSEDVLGEISKQNGQQGLR